MKIALVVPSKANKAFNELCIPFSLLYIASYLKREISTVELKVFDGLVDSNIEEEIFQFQPEIVGITSSTPIIQAAYQLGDMLRNNRPDILTVIGGVHVSALPTEALNHFDIVVVGEGEKAFTQIVKQHPNNKKGVIIQGTPISNLDELPRLAYDLVDLSKYFKGQKPSFEKLYLKEPIMHMITSRGCVGHCPFCINSTTKTKLRFFSPERVIDELIFLHEKYGLTNFFIHDDEFLADKQRFLRIYVLAKKYNIDKWLKFVCQTRVQSLHDLSVMLSLKSLGCKACLIGFESHNERNLSYMKYGSTTIEDQEKAVVNAKVISMPLFGSFIFGSKNETIQEMEDTLNWMLKIKLDVGFGLLVPFPGTIVFNDYIVKHGNDLNYEQLVMTNKLSSSFVMVDDKISRKDFIRFLSKASSLLRVKNRLMVRGFLSVLAFHVFWIDLLRYPLWTIKVLKYWRSI